jgi:HlyD family secretion protein
MLNYNKIREILKKKPGLSIAGGAVLVLVLWGMISLLTGGDAESSIPTYAVKKGPLKISITQTGSIQPKEKIIVKNKVEGSTAIVYLLDEGTHVNAGDLMMELDSSSLSDKKVDQEIAVQKAEASDIEASENFEVTKNQAQSDMESAQLAYDFAQQDLKKYLEGEYPNSLAQANSDITVAEESLSQAKDKLDWSKKLNSEKYLSQTELETDTLSYNQKEIALGLKKSAKALLENYTYKRQLAKLQSDVVQAKSAMERTTRKAKANIAQAEANKASKKSELERQQAKLEKLKNQLEATKIYAPAEGTIIYATSAAMSQSRFGSRTEPLKVGNNVQERQELIHLPTTAGFTVTVSIPEGDLDKIKVGLPVRVTIDTLPGQVYTGSVSTIASVVNAQNAFMNPDLKVYDTVITLENGGDLSLLRSGMSCSAEIIVAQYEDAIYVPVQAVMSVAGKSTVYIVKGEKLKPRTVETGLDNNIVIRIMSGLEPEELVSLSPPLAQSAVAEQTYEKLTTDMKVTSDGTTKSGDQKTGTETPAASPGNQGAAPTQGSMPAQGQGTMPQGAMPAPGQGVTSQGSMPTQEQGSLPSQGSMPAQGGAQTGGNFITRFDKDGDGKISKAEVQGQEEMFTRFDKNGDGYISKDEAPQGRPSGSQSKTQGENQTSGRYSTTGSTSDSSSEGGGMSGGPGGGPGGGMGGGGGMP